MPSRPRPGTHAGGSRAREHAGSGPQATAAELAADFGGPLPQTGMPAAEVVDYLAAKAEPGLMAMPSGRFFGWVIGGTLPAALAADWLISAWDQNSGLRFATPATAAIEEAAGKWILELLDLPEDSDVGFATGATMANFTGLAAARWRLMADAGWDLDGDGLAGAPRIRCFVGQERHDTIDLGLRYLGLGRPTVVPSDRQGRIIPAELDCALDLALSAGEGGRAGPGPRVPAGRQPAFGRLRPLRRGHRRREGAWRLGARGRRVRTLGGRRARLPP